MKLTLNADELSALTHALSVAADRFDEDAKTMDEVPHPGLAGQFRRQAQQTRELLDQIEDAPLT